MATILGMKSNLEMEIALIAKHHQQKYVIYHFAESHTHSWLQSGDYYIFKFCHKSDGISVIKNL